MFHVIRICRSRGTDHIPARQRHTHGKDRYCPCYRNVPVYPDDRHLLGMEWEGSIYVDSVLPFGLRSAPKIFSALSDTLEWIFLRNQVQYILHYLDDFFTAGAPLTDQCKRHLASIIAICERLGLPLATDKVEGPSKLLIFLGILLDSHLMQMRLQELKTMITLWLDKKVATKRDLLSLIGHLAYASKVVLEGRPFLRRMIDLASSRKLLDHPLRLNTQFRSDLLWWHLFLEDWNGVSCLQIHTNASPDITLYTDASGSWGCAAAQLPHWFQLQWPTSHSDLPIATKELLPIVMAVAIWGRRWP